MQGCIPPLSCLIAALFPTKHADKLLEILTTMCSPACADATAGADVREGAPALRMHSAWTRFLLLVRLWSYAQGNNVK